MTICLQKEVLKMLVASIYILVLLIFALIAFAVMQIKLAGLNVKDFISFIKANDMLDKLYNFAQRYERLSPMEQLIFLKEADEVFQAFNKVPDMLWEDEYQKYLKVLNTYRDIRVLKWQS